MSFHALVAHFYLALNNIPLSQHTSLFIHSPTEGCLGCFRVLAAINKVSINIPVHVFMWHKFLVHLNKYQRVIARAYGKSMFSVLRLSNCLPKWMYHFAFLPAQK